MSAKLIFSLVITAMTPLGAQNFNPRASTTAEQTHQMWSRGQAKGEGLVKLQGFPLRLDDIG